MTEQPEGEALFRAVFEQAAVGFALIETATGRFLRVNQSLCDLVGYGREELERTSFQAITHPDDRAGDQALLGPFRTGEVRSLTREKRYVRKDGSVVWVSATISALWAPGAPPDRHLAIVQDVTERKRAEAALRDTEEIFGQLLEHSPIHVFFKDEQIRALRLSRNFEAMLGRPLDQILGRTMDDLFPSDLARSMVADDRRILQEGKVVEVDEELDGRHYHTVKFPIHRGGKPSVLGGFTIDLTERHRVEAALRESEEKYRTLYNEAPVMLHSIDAEGRLLNVSNRWLEVLGYERGEVLGRKSTEFLTEASRRYAQEVVLPEFFRTGVTNEAHYQFVTKRGAVLDVLLSAVAERTTTGEFVCSRAALVDVTERLRIEHALRQSQKMESVGRLAGGIAHDFNNLLSAIMGNTELALLSLREGDAVREDLLQVQQAAQRAAALTQQLLAFSRKQVLQPRTIDLNKVVSGIDGMLRRLIGEDVELRTVLAPDLSPTRADPGQIEQVIVNLSINARDAMPGGGRLTLATANAVLPEGVGTGAAYVTLAVTDSGVGMDESVRAHLFEPFFTTKEKGKGTGLGLATVYGIVKQSGGDIRVVSAPGQGTRVSIFLPAARGATAEDEPEQTEALRATGHETIVVVEDEAAVRSLAVRILEACGYTVLAAADGPEAIATCRAHPGPVHLLLTDVVMPQMSGTALAAQLGQGQAGLKVLYMSGYTDDAIGHRGVLDAGTNFIAKPFTSAELTRRVREVLDGR